MVTGGKNICNYESGRNIRVQHHRPNTPQFPSFLVDKNGNCDRNCLQNTIFLVTLFIFLLSILIDCHPLKSKADGQDIF